LKLKEISKDDLIFGRRIWWEKNPGTEGWLEVKMSSDNTKFFFIRKEATYELTLKALREAIEKQIKKKK